METYPLNVIPREKKGKAANKKLRAQGKIPANIYGEGEGNMIFSIDEVDLKKLLSQEFENMIIEISLKDKKLPAIIKEIHRNVVTERALHVDFQHIQAGKLLRISIPVHLKGDAPGAKKGGIVEHFLRDVQIECLPKDIPHEFAIDISEMEIGDSVHVGDIPITEQVRILDSEHTVIVSIVTPRKVEEEKPEAAEGEGLEGVEGQEVAEGAEGEAQAEESANKEEE